MATLESQISLRDTNITQLKLERAKSSSQIVMLEGNLEKTKQSLQPSNASEKSLKAKLDTKRGKVDDEVKAAEAARDKALKDFEKVSGQLAAMIKERDGVKREFDTLSLDYQNLDKVYKSAEKQVRSQEQQLRSADIKKGQLQNTQNLLRLADNAIDNIYGTLPWSRNSKEDRIHNTIENYRENKALLVTHQ